MTGCCFTGNTQGEEGKENTQLDRKETDAARRLISERELADIGCSSPAPAPTKGSFR
jgi:hypothetical protein